MYLTFFLPNIKLKDVKGELTKERIKKGEYIVRASGCVNCHTPVNSKGEFYTGGRKFPMGETEITVSTNIAFDKNAGI